MELSNYRFGYVEAGDSAFENDLIVMDDWIHDNWWRQDGHSLVPEDLEDVVRQDPDRIILGTGAHGRMNVPEDTKRDLDEKGIDLEVHRTEQAIEEYNRQRTSSDNVAGAFHLTC